MRCPLISLWCFLLSIVCAFSASAGPLEQRTPDPDVVKILDSLQPGESAWLPPVNTAGDLENAEVKRFKLDETGPRPR